MGPHWDSLWPRWLFPLHFFDGVRIGLLYQSPQSGQCLATPIARHLNYDVYLLTSRLVFHASLSLQLPDQLIILHVRVREPSRAPAMASRSVSPASLLVPYQSREAGRAALEPSHRLDRRNLVLRSVLSQRGRIPGPHELNRRELGQPSRRDA